KIEQIAGLIKLYAFDHAAAKQYASIRIPLEKLGTPVSERDTQIAAVAKANNLTVVTHNVKEFSRIKKLDVEDWPES
ncbi:MAG: PIN domain-containing protein, partial [Desulfobacterales bacterium]